MRSKVQWFWHFFTFLGMATYPWLPDDPIQGLEIYKKMLHVSLVFQIFGPHLKMRVNFKDQDTPIFTKVSAIVVFTVCENLPQFHLHCRKKKLRLILRNKISEVFFPMQLHPI